MINDISEEQAIDLIAGDYGEESLKQIANYAAPIFWVAVDDKENLHFENGSMFFVNAGEGIFAVTASHVFEGYLNDKDKYRNIKCAVAPNCFDPSGKETILFDLEERVIANDTESDIATFSLNDAEMESIGTFVIRAWPPVIPQIDLGIGLAGFPGHERIIQSRREISFAPFPILGIAKSVNDRLISVQIEEDFVVDTPGFKTAAQGYSTPGMSGGPLLTHIDSNGIHLWALGGVITDGWDEGGLIMASRADRINADGTIQQSSLP